MANKTRNKIVRDEFLELVQSFPLKPIRTSAQLSAAHAMIDRLTRVPEKELSNDQADYLEVLGSLTLAYEEKEMGNLFASVNGLDVLKHLLDEHEMNASKLGTLLGHRELGSKILRGERNISKNNAKTLGEYFGVSAEIFLR